ncbi:MAG: LacI family transcriptional regulator [Verrucomicrobiota bacterium]|nr:LacI family transcriptional regulator [Verrucomicrobiota bacterium]
MEFEDGSALETSPPVDQTVARHEHHKTITMAAIAKAAGVSQGAISSLLNDRDYGIRVSEKTRDRVFKACRELKYIPNDLRAVVRMYPDMGDLCLLVSSDAGSPTLDFFTSRLIAAATDAVTDSSHHATIARYDPDTDYVRSADLLPHPIRSGTASKFICLGTPNQSLFQALTKRGYPVVNIGRDIPVPGVASILPDYSAASRLALDYLHRLGHRHIAILAGPFGTADSKIIELNHGLRIGFENLGIPLEAQNIIYGDLTFQSGASAAEVFLSRSPRPTALFCLTDAVAAGAISYAAAHGLKIPQDLSIIGCGDEQFAALLSPALTTIHLPAEEMGTAAVHEVEARARDVEHPLLEAKKTLMPVRLVERQSVAAPTAAQ